MKIDVEFNEILGIGVGLNIWPYVVDCWLNEKTNRIQSCRYWNLQLTLLHWDCRIVFKQPLPKRRN